MPKLANNTFLPARLVKGHRWYLVYYQIDPSTGERVRFRETYELNRIPDLIEREKRAQLLISQINAKLPLGFPFEEAFKASPPNTNILDALAVAKRIKNQTDRKRTRDMVNSICNIFTEFLARRDWTAMRIGEFERQHALAFLDYAVFERGVGNRTHNNYIERMRALFTELKLRKYVPENPFSGFKKKKVLGKQRRAFNQYEKQVVAREISRTDKWLMLGVLLQYHCFIRPIEMRRLRFYMFDLQEGLIRMSGHETKNKENAIVTIPNTFLPFLRKFNFQQWDQRWLLFGEGVQPHPNKSCGHNTMNWRHNKILNKLEKEGEILDTKGLTYYSWKDTGALALFKQKVNPLEIMRQLRHKDLATTQLYCQSLYNVNQEIKVLNNNLLGDDVLDSLK